MSQHEGEPQEITLLRLREKYGFPDPETLIYLTAIKELLPGLEEDLLELTEDKEVVLPLLSETREYLRNIKDLSPVLFRPILCTLITSRFFYQYCMRFAREALQKQNSPQFLFLYDLGFGAAVITSRILPAEDAPTTGGVNKITWEIMSLKLDYLSSQTSVTDEAEEYLGLHRFFQKNKKLLMEDPTGLKLITQTLTQLREDARSDTHHFIPSFMVPEIVIAGAELAQKVYQAIYPLTKDLPKT